MGHGFSRHRPAGNDHERRRQAAGRRRRYDHGHHRQGEAEDEDKHEDEAEDKKLIKKMMKKQKMKEDMDADVGALLSGENLSEEFKGKASTIFEAAVTTRVTEVVESIEGELMEQFEEAVESYKAELAEKVDDYLNYFTEEWYKDNQIAIEKGLRQEIVEEFITELRDVFAKHYIDIPTEKVDIVEELVAKVEDLEGALTEEVNKSVQMKKELNESKKVEAIHAVCEGLTQTQVEKLKSLAEGVEFTTETEFAEKLETLKESYIKAEVVVQPADSLNQEVVIEEEKDQKKSTSADPLMEHYAKTISQTLKG
jgi:hypothetical protein